MSERRISLAAAIGLLLAGLGHPGLLRGSEQRLNVLLVTADDLGPYLSAYGETLIQTPNLDALAHDGVRFEVAYSADASCSPSRSTLFTGLHSHATGQYGLSGTGFSLHPQLRGSTIPNLLGSAGYRTGIIGKLHVEPESAFDFDFRHTRGGTTRYVRQVAALADAYLREAGDAPFFLMVNYSDPHAMRQAGTGSGWHFPERVDGLPAELVSPSDATPLPFQPIDTAPQRVRTAGYYNAVRRLDDGFGMLMEVLAKHDHVADTLVIFVGDQGPPFVRGKTTLYEAGVRVPFIVRWPGVSKPMSSAAMVSTIDILPTILDATGVRTTTTLHGKSLRPVLQDEDAPWRPYLVAEFHFHDRDAYFPRRAIRDGRYKLIHNILADTASPAGLRIDGDRVYQEVKKAHYEGTAVQRAFATFANPPEIELYDLETDPIEFHNLAEDEQYRHIRERLSQALLQYRRQTDDPFLDATFVEAVGRGPGS